jgi:hypothetical protein
MPKKPTEPKDLAPFPAAEAPIADHSPGDFGSVARDAGTLGRPRRSSQEATPSKVWLDKPSKRLIQREFGSLGNGLYFLAKGILAFRRRHGLTGHEETQGTEPDALEFSDLVVVRDVLWHRVDQWKGDDAGIAPSIRVLRRVEALLYGGAPYPGGLPPLSPPDPRPLNPGAARPDRPAARAMSRSSGRPAKGSMSPGNSSPDDSEES